MTDGMHAPEVGDQPRKLLRRVASLEVSRLHDRKAQLHIMAPTSYIKFSCLREQLT